ncbi:MAG: histidine kinase [Lachnospiraceae bacterium]|nr:histidine kinase [Lachnospiraceae bacterium]
MEINDILNMANTISTLVSIILAGLVLVVTMQMKNHTRRIGWFIMAICVVIGGLTIQIMGESAALENKDIYTKYSYALYSFVAPIFGVYFIETEREEGQKWDGYFWTALHVLLALLVIIITNYDPTGFQAYTAVLLQYSVILVMLLFSSKSIKASAGFMAGIGFPMITSLAGMGVYGLNITGFGEIMLLLFVFFLYQMDTERDLMVKQVELSNNKVSLLMEQIHPHFIYNALQQIALLCDEEPQSVKNAIYAFSGYLRKNLESLTNEGMIPFEREMEHVDMFIELAQILPSKDFVVEKHFEITDFKIPALVVQPLVENAIKYGIGMSTEGDKILIETKVEGGYIVIRVVDDGHGKQTELTTQKKHKSVGTQNVKTRLKILCDGEMIVNRSDEGTEAIVRIPEIKARSGF